MLYSWTCVDICRLDEAVKRIAQLQNKANKKSSLVEADLLKETKEELLERCI